MVDEPIYDERAILNRLIHVRKKSGLTQNGVESRLNWRRGALYDYEKGRLKITLEATWQLLHLYGADWNDVFPLEKSLDDQKVTPSIGPLIGSLAQLGVISKGLQGLVEKMRLDPILIAEIGFEQIHGPTPLLRLLLDKLSATQRREYFLELCRYVNSMIAVDKAIKVEEKRARDILLDYALIELDENEKASLLRAFESRYFGKGIEKKFPRDATKHLLIWILFIVALSDGELNHHELDYVEAVAETIGMKKNAYEYIRMQIMNQPL